MECVVERREVADVKKDVGKKLKLVCREEWAGSKKVWRITTEKEDFELLKRIVARLTQLTYDWVLMADFPDLQMSIKEEDQSFVIYKDTRAFDLHGEEVDISEDELGKFITMLKETKKELERECMVKIFEI